jgi:hypothetical protein
MLPSNRDQWLGALMKLKSQKIESIDPDVWIANDRSLLDFPFPPESLEETRQFEALLLAAGPVLTSRLERWLRRIAAMNSDEEIGDHLTEEHLRALWEETGARAGHA